MIIHRNYDRTEHDDFKLRMINDIDYNIRRDRRLMKYFPISVEIQLHVMRDPIADWCHAEFGGAELITLHSGDRRKAGAADSPMQQRRGLDTQFNEWLFSEDDLNASRFTYYSYKFFFKYETDAIFFKLRWG